MKWVSFLLTPLLALLTMALSASTAQASNRVDFFSRNMLRKSSSDTRRNIAFSSDILQYSLVAAPLVIDSYFLLTEDSDKKNWHPLVGDLAAFGITFGLTTLAKEFLSRERPFVRECTQESDYDEGCDAATSKKSFFSGHTALAFTGAALLCSDNERTKKLSLGVCIVAMGAATTTGVLRIMADKHYATDVLAGATVGTLSGLFIPKLMAEIWPRTEEEKARDNADGKNTQLTPVINTSEYGMQLQMNF